MKSKISKKPAEFDALHQSRLAGTKNLDLKKWGVSFSVKQCRNLGVDPEKCLDWLLKQGFRRFRLMSYWNECEKSPKNYDFKELDRQIKQIQKYGGKITLCLGARQPRWPESHWPDWAWIMKKPRRDKALMEFIKTTVNRYKNVDYIVSYQLENEALLVNFGERTEIDRARLRAEYNLVKRLDPKTPIIMTTSTAFGIPMRRPRPHIVGFSFYSKFFDEKLNQYTDGKQTPFSVRLRKWLIKLLWRRPSFIHELQLEPWGPKAIWEIDIAEQDKSMGPDQIAKNIALAKKTKLTQIDLWGGEWWYWRTVIKKDTKIWQAIKNNL